MNTDDKRTKPFIILVGVDYSDLGELALLEAFATEALRRAPTHVHVVHAVSYVPSSVQLSAPEHGMTSDKTATAQVSEHLWTYVEKVLKQHHENLSTDQDSIIERLTTHVRHADAAEAIAQLASDIEADLVVVGTHGHRGLERLLLGSVAEGVVRLAPCPVLVVRPRGATAATNIPRIEPPCPLCLEIRQATDGKEFWCPRHSEHHERRHTYHFRTARTGHQSGLLIPLIR